jgi:hypothetical protein
VRGRRAGAAVLRPEINHRPLINKTQGLSFLHSNYRTLVRLFRITFIVCEIACYPSLTLHIHRKPLRCISAPFVIVETWDEDDLFRTGKSVSPVLGQDVWSPILSFSYSAVVRCAKFVGAHVTACLIDMLKLSTFRTLRILQFATRPRYSGHVRPAHAHVHARRLRQRASHPQPEASR